MTRSPVPYLTPFVAWLHARELPIFLVAQVGFSHARRGKPGTVFLAAIALYSVGRLVLELARDDLGRGGGLGVASLLSLAALGFVAWGTLRSVSPSV